MPSNAARHTGSWFDRLAAAVYPSALYGLALREQVPSRLQCLPPAPWPGDIEQGRACLAGRLVCGGKTIDPEHLDWHAESLGPHALRELHGFAWLGDLAAVGDEAAQAQARRLIESWLSAEQQWHPIASAPGVIGQRIASWLAHAAFFSHGPDDELGPHILGSLARQGRHLARTVGRCDGLDRLLAMRGIIYAACCGIGDMQRADRALRFLRREIHRQVLEDGGHAGRSPAGLLTALATLVDIRDMAHIAGATIPQEVNSAIERMAILLRFFRHGDGRLALFNSADEQDAAFIDAVLSRSGAPRQAAAMAQQSGFQRLQAGQVLVFMDVGRPPPPGFDRAAHAGALSFEMSCGRERVIVNCGAAPVADPAWRLAQRATAAHSTLVVNDTNSAEIAMDGSIGRGPATVECARDEGDGSIWITASHDGYKPLFGLVHRRRLYLSRDGEDLRGEDTLTGQHAGSFAARFHLHPDVQVSIIQNGAAALLRTPSGAAWRFLVKGGKLDLAETVYLGRPGEIKRSEQIVISGPVSNGATIKWAIRRVAKT